MARALERTPSCGMVERHPRLRRPPAMRVDTAACVRCGLCDAILPGVLAHPERIATSPAALEAMAACPTGAIVWLESDVREEDG
jgi:ferredoxin